MLFRSDLRALAPLWRTALACVPAALCVTLLRPWLNGTLNEMTAGAAFNPQLAAALIGGALFAALFVPSALFCGAIGETEKVWLRNGWQTFAQKFTGWRTRLVGLVAA